MYHFALRTDDDAGSVAVDLAPRVPLDRQKTAILRMSHGVAVILLLGKTRDVSLRAYS